MAGEVITETWALADSANKVASKALSDAQAAIDSSGEANAELEALLDPNNENSALWAIQWQINENDRIALERHQELIEANMQAIATIRPHVTRTLWLNAGVPSAENEFMRLYRSTVDGKPALYWEVKPGWVGTFQVIAGYAPAADPTFSEKVYMEEHKAPNPSHDRFWAAEGISSALVTINVSPGKAKVENLPISDQAIGRSWQTLQSWTVPQDTDVNASARLTFANKTRIADYGLRILVNGSNNTSSSASSTAPLFGHEPRSHSASMNTRRVKAGSVISVQAKADHSNSLNRQITNASFDVTWIDGTDA